MTNLFDIYIEKLILTLFIFIRITGIFVIAPLFRSQVVRPAPKIFLGILVAFLLSSALPMTATIDFHPLTLAFVVLKELLVGFLIGFSLNLVFWGANFAGGLIDFEVGFYAARLLSFSESTPSVFGEILELMTLMIFLAINGHFYIFEALYVSLQKIPIGMAVLKFPTFVELGRFLAIMTIIALKLAAPIFVATFLINISLAMLARMAPQANIFVVSFQIKIIVALIGFFVSVPLFGYACKYFLQEFQRATLNLLVSIL